MKLKQGKNMQGKIYLDNNATTPLHQDVLDSMMPFLKEDFGNPSSIHQFGRKVKVKIDEYREKVAAAIGADPSEIVFTSGGSESDNFAIKGYAWANKKNGKIVRFTPSARKNNLRRV